MRAGSRYDVTYTRLRVAGVDGARIAVIDGGSVRGDASTGGVACFLAIADVVVGA
jgi:hypothetical protein